MTHDVTQRIHRIWHGEEGLDPSEVFGDVSFGAQKFKYFAIKTGATFHVGLAFKGVSQHDGQIEYVPYGISAVGEIYAPVHPSTTVADVEGATHAHDTGTHWVFSACSPGEHIEFAARAKLFATAQFYDAVQTAQIKATEVSPTNQVAKSGAVAKVKALLDFSQAVGDSVQKTVLAATLGHYHADPNPHHEPTLTTNAIKAVLADWKQKALTDTAVRAARAHITADAGAVVTELAKPYKVEWRHERVARLAAEAKAKKAAAETSPAEGAGD